MTIGPWSRLAELLFLPAGAADRRDVTPASSNLGMAGAWARSVGGGLPEGSHLVRPWRSLAFAAAALAPLAWSGAALAQAPPLDPAAMVLIGWGRAPPAADEPPAVAPPIQQPPAISAVGVTPDLASLASAVGDERSRSIDCLAAAIHYEAANEPGFGRHAVAEVVLNRVNQAGYPKTVCGVVFQGSKRRTGCQFTFTCDGSLRRRPSAAAWTAARRIAEEILSGARPSGVGAATNYHANYVRPYWSPSLVKIIQIGAHIFYRAPGSALPAPGRSAIPTAPAPAELLMAAMRVSATKARETGSLEPWGLTIPSEAGGVVTSAW